MTTKAASRVKGTKINSKLTFLADEYGEPMVAKVLDAVEPSDRSKLSSVVDLGWYDIALYQTLIRAIVEVAGRGHAHILERIGTHNAEELSRHAYKAYYRSGDPETVLRKMIPVHTALNDPGEMDVVQRQDRIFSVIVTEPRGSLLHCKVASAFYQRSVELCGVANVAVEETRCAARGDAACEFVISWD